MADFNVGWASGLPETVCGAGSTLERTGPQRKALAAWVERYDIHSLVDIGAGDLHWIQAINWPWPMEYTALDLVPRHPAVSPFDLIYKVPPDADCGMCLWLLNHLPEHHARQALYNLQQAKYRCLIYTWWPAMADFLDLGWDERVTINPAKAAELRLLCC